MDEDRKKEIGHEDNSVTTKFAVVFAIALVAAVIIGCLLVVREVITFFMNWD